MFVTTSSRFAARAVRSTMALRAFSSDCAPAEKLRNIFEEYRLQNYSQETPYRFKKEMVNAAQRMTGSSSDKTIRVDALNQILVNIGRSEDCLSDDELNLILAEADSNDRNLPVEKLLQLM